MEISQIAEKYFGRINYSFEFGAVEIFLAQRKGWVADYSSAITIYNGRILDYALNRITEFYSRKFKRHLKMEIFSSGTIDADSLRGTAIIILGTRSKAMKKCLEDIADSVSKAL